MAYVSLYRRYRPQTFGEVVGQRHVTETLMNAIREDRLHHAYLFTGPRGTGKTSTARILAKALNCEEGPTPEPCETCAMCVAITEGSAVDVVELDMASHGGVDDARDLRERALFSPARARRKVYILDEVHMASTAAFNALLKLIEEPPAHVLFAMATTEPQKVLPTIMSRVQRLDLRRVGHADLAAYTLRIAEREGAEIDDAAIDAIVRAGEGSVRDTLSILEQVLAFSGGKVTSEHVSQLLGHTPAERVFSAVEHIAARDLRALFQLVQALTDDGQDLRRFALDLAGHLRDLLVTQVVPDRPDLVDASPDHRARLAGQAGLLTQAEIVRAIEALGDALVEMRRGPARLPLELALADVVGVGQPSGASAAPAASTPPVVVPEAETVPDKTETASVETEPPSSQAEPDEEEEPAEASVDGVSDDPAPDGGEVSIDALRAQWEKILDVVKGRSPRVQAICAPSTPSEVDGEVVVIDFPAPNQWHAEELGRTENAEVLRAAIEQVTGARLHVRTRLAEDAGGGTATAEVEQVSARDVEAGPIEDEKEAAARADEILREELGAVPVDDGGS